MKPEEITPSTAASGNFNQTHDHLSRSPETTEFKSNAHRQTDKVETPRLDHVQFNELDAINTDTSNIARDIRMVNESMDTIDSHLQKMQKALESIVKIYPPYPPGSSERIEALRQFSAFRKMIDRIASPGRSGGMQALLGDPAQNPGSADVRFTTGKDRTDLIIRRQPAHAGPGGLDLPKMGADSPDLQITAAIEKTNTARQTLSLKRRNFIADANRVLARIA